MPNYFNTSLRNLTYRLRAFKEVLSRELKNEILAHEDVIIGMIHEQLYEQGITGKGVEIASYAPYTARTIQIKQKKGQPTDRVTLKDTGRFYGAMYIEFDSQGFYVTSYDKKTEALIEKYGPAIFRLTNENLGILIRDYIRPGLKEKMKKYLLNG